MNGWEFMEQYQKLIPKMNKSVPVVILSTSDNEQDLLKAKEFAQIIRYIVKPLSIQKLKDLQSHFALR